MAQNALGVEVPAGTDAFDPQGDMVQLADSLSGRVIVPVTNAAARQALLASEGSSEDDPLLVAQQDDGAYMQHDGTRWTRFASVDMDVPFALDPPWNARPGTAPAVTRRGGRWLLSVAFVNAGAGLFQAAWTKVGVLPAAARATPGQAFYGSAGTFGAIGRGGVEWEVNTATGDVRFFIPADFNAAAGGFGVDVQASWDAWPAAVS